MELRHPVISKSVGHYIPYWPLPKVVTFGTILASLIRLMLGVQLVFGARIFLPIFGLLGLRLWLRI
jgi:hypothetical protein